MNNERNKEILKRRGALHIINEHRFYTEASVLAAMNEAAYGGWIDVNDMQKPKAGQKVLVIQDPFKTATREPLFAIYNGKDFIPPQPTYFADFEIGKSTWSDITHWRPLPSTPQNV